MYWIVRTNKNSEKNKRFVDDNIWENADGYDKPQLADFTNKIQKNDILLLADSSYIKYFGVCKQNIKNGKTIKLKKWIAFDLPYFFKAQGSYAKTISPLKNASFLKKIQQYIQNIETAKEFYINSLYTKNFMSLNHQEIVFSKGINLFIGENGTGKSQILKLLYSVLDANNNIALEKEEADYEKQRQIATSLTDVFKIKLLGNLVTKNTKEAVVTIDFKSYKTSFKFGTNSKKEVLKSDIDFVKTFIEKKTIFIPAKEVLSFFPGFRTIYERKYLEFDKCYYNLCKALEEPLSKKIEHNKQLIKSLEKILDGKIEIIDGIFHLVSNDDKKYEINLVAEGFRKIGLLAYLLSNEALDNNSILFWDEPESNLNPKLITEIVKFLVTLANSGMQIFISTHSPYIIEALNNHLKKDKIKDIKVEDKKIQEIEALNPKYTSAYLLDNGDLKNILNPEYGLLDDKLLHSFNSINRIYDQMRDIEWECLND